MNATTTTAGASRLFADAPIPREAGREFPNNDAEQQIEPFDLISIEWDEDADDRSLRHC